jgi:hypothetical protein
LSPILEAALELQRFCEVRSWRFCFIGGIVVPRWGEPRTTADADLTLLTGFGGEEAFIDAILASFRARRDDARELALTRRVLLVAASNSVPLDVSLGALPFEERLIDRSSTYAVAPGVSLRTCSGEDLLVLKAFAGRDQDWLDIRGVATRQAGRLDEALILRELEPLLELKGAPEGVARLREILDKARWPR